MSRFSIGVFGFIAMMVGLSSYSNNLNPWALLIGVMGALLTIWGGAYGQEGEL